MFTAGFQRVGRGAGHQGAVSVVALEVRCRYRISSPLECAWLQISWVGLHHSQTDEAFGWIDSGWIELDVWIDVPQKGIFLRKMYTASCHTWHLRKGKQRSSQKHMMGKHTEKHVIITITINVFSSAYC